MSNILNDFSTPALINAVKSNLYEFFRYLGRSTQTELFTSSALMRWHTTTPHPWFNGVLSTQPASDNDQHTVQDVIPYFQSRSVVFLGAGVAGVQFVATLQEARGQGIGAAMTLAPLHEVQQMGYQIGILQSSDMGVKLYQQLGFQRLYTETQP